MDELKEALRNKLVYGLRGQEALSRIESLERKLRVAEIRA